MKSIFLALSLFLFSPFYPSFQPNEGKKTTKSVEIGSKPHATVLSVGTLYSGSSPAGKMLKTWADALNKKTNGEVEIKLFYSAQQGDEGTMVGKMKTGQLSGAAISSVGLAKIYKPIGAMSMFGLFKDWNTTAKALDVMKPEFEQGISDAGFTQMGWYYNGAIRFMSKGTPLKVPTDFQKLKNFSWKDDANIVAFYSSIGGFSPISLSVPDVLPNLNTGAINALYTSSMFAEQMLWAAKLDNLCEEVDAISIGGIVFSSKSLEALTANQKDILLDNTKTMSGSLRSKIMNEDAAAFGRLKGKMSVVTRSAAEKDAWNAVFQQARQKLAQGTYSAALVSKLEGLAQ
jgi:TRAP-type C4-dicarboxylate transport system substrate-binding protein